MRLIDADALKKYIDMQKGRPFIGCTIGEALKIMTDEQPTIAEPHNWIPVSERLPELDEDGYSEKVLACFDWASLCEICEYRTDKWYIGDTEDSPEDIGLRVIAWMPMPERHKEENTDI